MTRRLRLLSVVALVLAGAIGVVSSTQTWVVATLVGPDAVQLPVPGADAAPVLAPLSLAVLALGLALSIGALVLRYVFGALAVAAGIVLVLATQPLLVAPPLSTVSAAVTTATGIAGAEGVASEVVSVDPTAWPLIAMAGWVVLIGGGVLALATAHRWARAGRRFRTEQTAADAAPAAGPLDAIDSWDGLSRGEDPTDERRSPPRDDPAPGGASR